MRVKGFLASALSCGIKEQKKDLALIYSQRPVVAAGTFTSNRIKAAPVKLTKRRVGLGLAQAIIINSGNANACTGKRGQRDARLMTRWVARELSIPERLVLVASTGVIGRPLPIERIKEAIPSLIKGLHQGAWGDVAEAIMTTDAFPKLSFAKGIVDNVPFSILGIAKGAGMIMPQMATMLAFFVTDIAISQDVLRQTFKKVVSQTFNRISVDGDTSTNDMAIVFANGLAKNSTLYKETPVFYDALLKVATELSKMIVKGAEGASKFIEICIKGGSSIEMAERVGCAVANSPLVKTAIYGEDPNWGRLMAAIGRSGARVKQQDIDIYFGKICLVKNGCGLGDVAEREARAYLKRKEIKIIIDLNQGDQKITWYTCDLSPEYIKINSAYHT